MDCGNGSRGRSAHTIKIMQIEKPMVLTLCTGNFRLLAWLEFERLSVTLKNKKNIP